MMNLEEQFKVVFFSFIYGMFFLFTIKVIKNIKYKKIIYRFITELIFMIIHVLLFYFLLYKINGGILSFYIALFFIVGFFFCRLLYFSDKKSWNFHKYHYIIKI